MPIFTNPRTGARIEVAEHDLPVALSWDDAAAACQALGDGWRLPTEDELAYIYRSFFPAWSEEAERVWYWAAEENTAAGFGKPYLFYHGYEPETRYEHMRVRPVRTLAPA